MTKRRTHPDDPYTVADLCRVTGWSDPTVRAAISAGTLPGYQAVPGGKFTIPARAFEAFCEGTWRPQPREIKVTPVVPLHRGSHRKTG
jgi:excisionase family DNA binding protein